MLNPSKAIAAAAPLDAQLRKARPGYAKLTRYYNGIHDLPPGPKKAREEYLRLLQECRSNWMRLVVDVTSERLIVQGFRSSADQPADDQAWATWQANKLDQVSRMIHTESLKLGLAFVSVWPGDDDGDDDEPHPVIRGETPLQVFVQFDDEDPWKPVAAWKSWKTAAGGRVGTLWTTPAVDGETECGMYRLRAKGTTGGWSTGLGDSSWEARRLDMTDPMSWCDENPLDQVPFVPFPNMPDLNGDWTSEIEAVLPIQDRINETIFNRLVAAEFAAFRQRWVTGLKVPKDPETGQEIEPFKAAVDRVWSVPDKDVKFGEFGESDLSAYIKGVEADIQHLAAITRTPPHYLLGQSGTFPSGESLKATEAGLMAKVGQRRIDLGEAWESVMRLAALAKGDSSGAADMASQVIWAKTEARTDSELVASLVQLASLGVPNPALWELYGASPQTIEQWKALAKESDSTAQLAALLDRQAKPVPPAA